MYNLFEIKFKTMILNNDPLNRDLRRLGRDDRDHGNLADGRPIPGNLADSRPLLPLTFKPRSVKLIHH